MIRAVGITKEGKRKVLLGLDAQNLNRLREGELVRVNLRHIDPDGEESFDLPDVDIEIFFAGTTEREALRRAYQRSHPEEGYA